MCFLFAMLREPIMHSPFKTESYIRVDLPWTTKTQTLVYSKYLALLSFWENDVFRVFNMHFA